MTDKVVIGLALLLVGTPMISIILNVYSQKHLVASFNINIQTQIQHSHEIVPALIAWGSFVLLIIVGVRVGLKKIER